jgi:hypothetical protein
MPAVKKRPADFRGWLAQAEAAAAELQDALRRPKADDAKADKAWHRSRLLCSQCHAKYRDVPQ